MRSRVRDALSNIRGGVAGILIYLAITAAVYVAAFMAAFGNDTPANRLILGCAGIYFLVANPIWMIPIAYFLGGCFLFSGPGSRERIPGE